MEQGIFNNTLSLVSEIIPTFSYCVTQSRNKIIKSIKITNKGKEDLSSLTLRITMERTFAKFKDTYISFLKAGESIEINNFEVLNDLDRLKDLNETEVATINIEILDSFQNLLGYSYKTINVLPLSTWGGDTLPYETLSSFITPNDDYVKNIVYKAKKELNKIKGNDNFLGYQNNDINEVIKEIEAIYYSIYKMNISYVNPPASFEKNGQKIRMAKQIYRFKMATCLDLSLLFLSAFEYIGLNTILCIIDGHSFIGVWLNNESFPSTINDNQNVIYNYSENSISKLILIETTSITQREDFINASNKARKLIEKDLPFFLAIDIHSCRLNGYKPLPTNKSDFLNEGDKEISIEACKMPDIDITELDSEIKKEEVKKDKFYIWKKKLLDLSLQNKLINMKIGTNNVQLLVQEFYEFYEKFNNSEDQFLLVDNGNLENYTSSKKGVIDCNNQVFIEIANDNFYQKRIQIFLNNKEFNTTIPSLYRKSKNDIDESGTNTLFLAFGLLEWKINKLAKKPNYAPIILLPVEIIKRTNKTFYLKRRDQEAVLNTTLLVYLKEEFKIDIDYINDLPLKNDGNIDLKKIYNTIRKHVMNLPGFKIVENVFLGRFSFSKFILWNEIESRKDILLTNPNVRSFVNGIKDKDVQSNSMNVKDIEQKINIEDLAIPLRSDSSQIEAIVDASLGDSFVLIGPPGTGKSQTIANMIVNSLYQGKKVLFCSEKKAALEVVYERLKTLRVDTFCMELHSNKQDKKEVLNTLSRVLEFGEVEGSSNFNTITTAYEQVEDDLREIVEKIHTPKNYPLSLYDALVSYLKYKEAKGSILISDELVNEFTFNRYNEIAYDFKKADKFAKLFKKFENNYFKIYLNKEYSKDLKDSLSSLLKDTIKKTELFNTLSKKLNKSLKIDSLSNETIENLYSLFDYLDNHKVYMNLLINEGSKDRIEQLISLITYEQETQSKAKEYKKSFNLLFLEQDLDNYLFRYQQNQSLFFFKKFLNNRKLIKEIRTFAINQKTINKNNLLEFILKSIDLKKELSKVKKNELIISSMLKEDYEARESRDYDYILGNLKYTLEVNKKLEEISKENLSSFIIAKYLKEIKEENASKNMINSYKELYKSLNDNLSLLVSAYKFDFNKLDNKKYLESLIVSLEFIDKNIDLINEWSNLLLVFADLENLGLPKLYDQYLKDKCNFDDLFLIFNKVLFEKIIDKLIKENNLTKFIGLNYDAQIEEFAKLDNEYKEEVVKQVVSKLSKNIPNAQASTLSSNEIGILKKAIKSNGRGLTVRKLFSDINETILRLCPCFLVSPLSCVKYLDPEKYNFDIVIFDEASQLSTSDAICVIARGKSFIVAGDDKQLPPTSFFDKQINEEDEDILIQDLESVLDDAIAIDFPIKRLLFHYRSKDESLIAFSNNKFYDNSLYTFPSPHDLKSKVQFIKINGIYDSGKSATNKEEAKELVKYLIKRLKNNPENKSFGIITFSVRQMDLIQNLLDDAIDNDTKLYEIIKNLKEDIFIKNLENVQGDERDVILLSICYGRNKNGRFIHNFGPINNAGGYRRLNVAITRSREEMYVFSSINYSDIDLSKTASEGVAYLKSFLEYAEFGVKALSSNIKEEFLIKSGVEDYIARDLRNLGYEAHLHLGNSRFKVDIAILNPKTKEDYVLGIVLDSYSYSNSLTTKDRNIVQFSGLKNLGWNLMMVWSLDYYDSPKKVIEEIVKQIGEYTNKRVEVKEIETPKFEDIEFVKIKKERISNLKPYYKYSVKNFYNQAQLENYRNRDKIIAIAQGIIDAEGPIAKTFLIKRLSEIFQIERKTKSTTQTIEVILSKLKNKVIYSYGLPFYFKDDSLNSEIKTYRLASERKIDEICKEEILVAIKDLLLNEISVDETVLKKEVSKMFGFKLKTKKIDEVLSEVIDYGITKAKVLKRRPSGYIELA